MSTYEVPSYAAIEVFIPDEPDAHSPRFFQSDPSYFNIFAERISSASI